MADNVGPIRKLLALTTGLALLAGACGDDADTDSGSDDADNVEAANNAESDSAATTEPEPFYGGHQSDIYDDDAHWLCKPGIDDNVCERDLDATLIHSGGATEIEEHQPAEDAAVDCFYVYPTVTTDPSGNSDLEPGEDEEIGAVLSQAARLSSVCDVYAPVYRQITVDAIGDDGDWDLAYADVLDAFQHYIDNENDGRDFVLVGHSQGSAHLRQLVMEEIDDQPELLDRMVAADLIGWAVNVPEGETVGGDFANVPACDAVDATGCVVSYSAYHDEQLPPAGDDPAYGQPRDAEFEGDARALCVNPANPGGQAFTQPYFRVDPEGSGLFSDADLEPFGEGSDEELTTPFATFPPDLLEVQCQYDEEQDFTYLEVTVHSDPGDGRLDDIGDHLILPGDPEEPQSGDWGLHLRDYQIAMGDIVAMVGAQVEAATPK